MAARESYYAESLAEQSTTVSASLTDALSYTLTPSAGKSYFIIATAEINCSSTSVKNKVNFSNTTDAVDYNVDVVGQANTSNYVPFCGITKYTDGGSGTAKTFKIQFESGTNGTTVKIKNCRICIIEVGANDQYFESTASSATNSTAIDKINSSFTPGSTGDYTLIWCADVSVSTTSSRAQTSVVVGATTYDQNIRQPQTATTDFYTQCGVLGLSALTSSSQTVQMVANVSSAVAGTIRNAKMIFLRHDGFDDAHFVYQGTAQAVTNTAYQDVTGASLTFTPANDKYLFLGGALQWGGSTSGLVGTQLLEDSTTMQEVLEAEATTTSRGNFIVGWIETPTNASHTWKFQFKASTSSANFQYGTITALKVGTITNNPSPTPTGVSATGAVGTVTPQVAGATTGVAGTGAAGTVTPQVAPVLTGVAATGAVGTPTLNVSSIISPTGVAATGQVGAITPEVAETTTGVAAAGAAGIITPQVTKSATGVAATGATGTVIPQDQIGPTGVAGAGASGFITPQMQVFPLGVQGNGQVGTVTVTAGGDASASPTGIFCTGLFGTVTVTITNPPPVVVSPQNAPGARHFRKAKHFYEEKPFHIDWDAIEKQRRTEFDEVVKAALAGRKVKTAPAPAPHEPEPVKHEEILPAAPPPEEHHLEYLMLMSS